MAALAWSHHAQAATLHRAALVIEHGSGAVVTRCVSFLEDQISGLQLVQRSGIEYQAQQFGSLGSAICQLDHEPSQVPSSCFGSGPYWQYFHRTSSGWVQSSVGASAWMIHDGAMDGWHYAGGADQAPMNMSFNAVCAAAAPSATVASSHSAPRSPATRSAVSLTATAPASRNQAAPSTSSVSASPSLEALATSSTPEPRTALANTGPTKPPGPSTPLGVWALLGGSAAVLLGLVGVNFRRRAP